MIVSGSTDASTVFVVLNSLLEAPLKSARVAIPHFQSVSSEYDSVFVFDPDFALTTIVTGSSDVGR
jgi:hypothetical protein